MLSAAGCPHQRRRVGGAAAEFPALAPQDADRTRPGGAGFGGALHPAFLWLESADRARPQGTVPNHRMAQFPAGPYLDLSRAAAGGLGDARSAERRGPFPRFLT